MPTSASTSGTRQEPTFPDLPSLGNYTETSDTDATTMCNTASASTSASTGLTSTCAPPGRVTPFTLAQQAKLPAHKKYRITGRIGHYLVKSLRPYSTVEDPYFRALMNELNPRYDPPNRACIAERVIPEMYNANLQSLKDELKKVDHAALTGDGWTSRTADHYLTLTAHYIDSDWDLKVKVLQTLKAEVSQTGDNIAAEIEQCMNEFGLAGKVEVMTTDNARAMLNAISKAGIGLSLGCFAHTLNLSLQKVMAIPAVQNMVGIMRPAITYFKNSYMGKIVFKEKQVALDRPRHSLLLDCKTRWNSSYVMVSRFLEQYPAVVASTLDDRIKTNHNFKKLQRCQDEDITRMEGFARVMLLPFQITEAMSAERRPTSGQVLPMLEKLRKHLSTNDGDTAFTMKIKKVIWDDLKTRYQDLDVRNFFEEACALDPRFKSMELVTEDVWERLSDAIKAATEKEVQIKKEPEEVANQAGPSQESVEEDTTPAKRRKLSAMQELFKDEDEVVITHMEPALPVRVRIEREMEKYKRLPKLPSTDDIVAFWRSKQDELPLLTRHARKYLIVPGTSVPSERVFSTAGDIVKAERASLDPKNVNMLLFLKKNT
ncbi:ZBED1 [Branchiostoma lanceolatum]|uniref:ZBED1 protein n=1 Tax=Branchiostoma lanceolatum TaxID=7740 RepID=A0A8K0ES70_BRALA|nr:ZBED1 [Branchiostoma lanceolatum]